MNIDKGLFTMYILNPPERTILPYGDKVQYTGKNGYAFEHKDLPFKVGDILTINEIYVDRNDSKVEFIEFPNKRSV